MSEAENIARARYARGEITKPQLDEILAGLADTTPRLAELEPADAKKLAKANESRTLSLSLLAAAAFIFLAIVLIPDPAGINSIGWALILLCVVASFIVFISSRIKS